MRSLRKTSFHGYRWPGRQRGAVMILVVGALLAILVMAALALDGGHMLLNKTRLQNAVDAAALSGAKALSKALDDPDAYLAAATAARATLVLNANPDGGNGELAKAINKAGGVGVFAKVEFSDRVYGTFYEIPAPGVSVRYVRVTVPDYPLAEFFWGILQAIGTGNDTKKAVAAMATAGPSPSAAPCDLAPLVVCGVEEKGSYYGYQFGDLEVLKTAANDESLANGNYQLLDFGNGAKTVGEQLAGGGNVCPEIGENVLTKPGNTVGPSISGLNTRLGDYEGSFKGTNDKYPPDLVVGYDKLGSGNNQRPALSLNDSGVIVYGADANGGNNADPGIPVGAKPNGDMYYSDADAPGGEANLLDYNDWKMASDACILDKSGCTQGGVFERRILKIVVGDCKNLKGGATQVPVLGFGCFFLVQPGIDTGGDAQIFGQFIEQCEGDGVAGPKPVNDQGPLIIQLYKSFISGWNTPSKDS